MKKRSIVKELLFYAVLIGLIALVLGTLFSGGETTEKPTYDKIYKYIEDHGEDIARIDISNKNVIKLTFKTDEKGTPVMKDENGNPLPSVSYKLADVELFREAYDAQIAELGMTYEIQPEATYPWWVSFLPWVLIIVAFVVIWIIFFNKIGGANGKMNSFGRARVKTPNQNDANKVLFRDVAGADEEKEELVEIVEFLKDPEKYLKLGARIPHGVLLMGPPGTGKTLLAKAVAGEAGVPFFSISGSDFVEMYVGVGASRVRDLFENARKSPAAIIFIDEIDAVGRHRGAGLGGGHDEREQTLNQLLVEMDGFGSHDGIIVMAATNRPDILDPALLRPGRFDRQITVNYPDIKGREEILKVHARNKPLESGVDFRKIAQSTIGFTGADLANLLNEAALLAAKRNKSLIGMDDIEEAYMKALLGPKKKARVRTEKDNKLTAYHEAGHAVVTYYCKHSDPVKHITIIPAGRAGGVTIRVPQEDVSYNTRLELLDDIKISLGGRIAEELVMDDISSGASQDIQQATKVARNMVTRLGMSERLGTVLYGSEHTSDEVFLGRDFSSGQNFSEKTSAEIDDEIRRIIAESYDEAKKIMTEHIDRLHFVAQYLLTHESMDGDQFAEAMKDDATVESVEAIAAAKEKQSREDNERRAAEDAAKAAAEAENNAASEEASEEASENASKDAAEADVPENADGEEPEKEEPEQADDGEKKE